MCLILLKVLKGSWGYLLQKFHFMSILIERTIKNVNWEQTKFYLQNEKNKGAEI